MVATKYAAELENECFTVVAVSPGFVDVSSTHSEPAPEGNIPKFNTIAKKLYGAFPKMRPLTPQEAIERKNRPRGFCFFQAVSRVRYEHTVENNATIGHNSRW